MVAVNKILQELRKEWNVISPYRASQAMTKSIGLDFSAGSEKLDSLSLSTDTLIQKLKLKLGLITQKTVTSEKAPNINMQIQCMISDFGDTSFLLRDKKGIIHNLLLQKNCDMVYGEDAKSIIYKIFNENQEQIGFLKGKIYKNTNGENRFFTELIETDYASNSRVSGLGAKITEFAKEHAKQNCCTKMDLVASKNAHMFHLKMGYRTNFENIDEGVEVLLKIKQSGKFYEYENLIDSVIKERNLENINSLTDIIFCRANQMNLRSADIGIKNINVPMSLDL